MESLRGADLAEVEAAQFQTGSWCADVLWLPRFYSSPAVFQSLTTSKSYKRLSKDDRRAVVESFVSEYRAANGGKFPTFKAIQKEVGGSYYVVRDILQELKLKPSAPLPIVAKALSEVSASLPNDASLQTLNAADADARSRSSACNAEHSSAVVVDPVFQVGSPDTIEIGNDQRQATTDSSLANSAEINLQGNNPVIIATNYKIKSESAPNNEVDSKCRSNLVLSATHDKGETEADVDSKCDSNTHPLESRSIVLEESLKYSETEEEKSLKYVGSQESNGDNLEGATVSENVLPTETRQVSARGGGKVQTEKKSNAWSNIMSFAKEFANFWRKA